jgi:hypothetical protein
MVTLVPWIPMVTLRLCQRHGTIPDAAACIRMVLVILGPALGSIAQQHWDASNPRVFGGEDPSPNANG